MATLYGKEAVRMARFYGTTVMHDREALDPDEAEQYASDTLSVWLDIDDEFLGVTQWNKDAKLRLWLKEQKNQADRSAYAARQAREARRREVGECSHQPTNVGQPRPYTHPVAVEPYTHTEPAAHGGVRITQRCALCGATRLANINGRWEEFSPWSDE